MASHSLYPGFVKLHYTSNTHPHLQVLPVIPALASGIWTVAKVLGGVYADWTTAIDAYVVILKALFPLEATIDSAELYTIGAVGDSPIFRATHPIGVAGTTDDPVVVWGEAVHTLRADNGGILKLYLMENINGGENHLPYASCAPVNKALFDFVQSSAGFIFARDGGVPISPLFLTTKTNDQLRKRFLLNA